MPMKKLFIVVNVDWFFLSHRLPIALKALEVGFDVTIIARDTGRRAEIEDKGLKFIDIPFDRSGTNPLSELNCISLLKKLYKKERPDVIHNVTLKACLLSSISAKQAGLKCVVNAISGFGYNFTEGRDGLKQRILRGVVRWAFRSKDFHYIFQNPDDQAMFSTLNLAGEKNIHIIKGSGVDLAEFEYSVPEEKEKIQVVLLARMLYDKGVVEFINASKLLKGELESKSEFVLVGDCDTLNLAGIKEEDLEKMIDPPFLKWVGFKKDAFAVLKNADIVVLPSYREGLPKTLIEACAVGRPIVTTDAIGCRECVVDGVNGFLVPVKNVDALSDKIRELILDAGLRHKMGSRSRTLAENEFSIDSVVDKHLSIYNNILSV